MQYMKITGVIERGLIVLDTAWKGTGVLKCAC